MLATVRSEDLRLCSASVASKSTKPSAATRVVLLGLGAVGNADAALVVGAAT